MTLIGVAKIIILLLLAGFSSFAQQPSYNAGFKILSFYDSSRMYKPNVPASHNLHYRPIDVDIWYPAETTALDSTASFLDLVFLLEKRSNFYDDTKNYDGIADDVLQYFCAGSDCDNYDTLKKIKTSSYVDAKAVDQQFPLILYLAGFNGMSYENYLLFEALAKKGFIVASISSIGRYPGNMSADTADLFEQVHDAEFILDYFTNTNWTNEHVGLVGYSLGGIVASILAMRNTEKIKAVVSLDGSEQFTYENKDDNEKLTRIRNSDFFKPKTIVSSYLYLDSEVDNWGEQPDSIFNFADYVPGDSYYLKINGSTHEDFSVLNVVAMKDQADSHYNFIRQLTINYLSDKLKNATDFYGTIQQDKVTTAFSLTPAKKNTLVKSANVVKGSIRDMKFHKPLSYVNVGVLNRDVGTTTDIEGKFELGIPEANINDTLKISMIGYEPRIIPVRDALKKSIPSLNISLKEKTNELKEVVITEKKLTSKVLGNKTTSRFFGCKFASDDLGSEFAIKIKIKEDPTYLEKFNFNISYNTEDTATFRINIYQMKKGLPDKNILSENIILRIGNQTGNIEVDLSEYNLMVYEDFFISLEWVEGNHNSGIVFSAGFVNKGTYYRKASQGKWKKYPIGVGLNVTGKY